MTMRDDERFRPKVGPPKARGEARQQKFISRVLKETSKAGKALGPRAKKTLRAGAKFSRGHVAARFAGQALSARSSRVAVKVRYVVNADEHPRSIGQHLRYMERDSATRDGEPGHLFDAHSERTDRHVFEAHVKDDRHHFRTIISPEDGAEIGDLKSYTRELMEQMERDLGTRLEWVAAEHWDTGHPHIHVFIRGKDETGQDLVIARDYISHGMRHRASEVATQWLGPRTDLEIRRSLQNEVEQERWTSLDATLKRQAEERRVSFHDSPEDAEGRFRRALLVGRLERLAGMGLATKIAPGSWELVPHVEDTLRAMGERGDIIRTMQRAFGNRQREYAIFNQADIQARIFGRIVAKGLADELYDRGYLVVDGLDGRAHYVPLPRRAELADFPVGGLVEVTAGADPRLADRAIDAQAQGGIYRTEVHLSAARQRFSDPDEAQAFVTAHVRRLEALRRAGIVERIEDGVWRVPRDLIERGRAYDAQRASGAQVELRSRLPIERQTRAIGATWLDNQLLSYRELLTPNGFGGEVRNALAQRTEFLIEQGLAGRRGQRIVFAQNLLQTLRGREVEAAAKGIESETGLRHRPLTQGQPTSGIYRRSLDLISGRYAMLDDATGFSLVPWRPVIEKRLGQSITATLQGDRVSWEFGRSRGLSI